MNDLDLATESTISGLRAALFSRVSEDDVAAVMEALVARAKAGVPGATAELVDVLRPRQLEFRPIANGEPPAVTVERAPAVAALPPRAEPDAVLAATTAEYEREKPGAQKPAEDIPERAAQADPTLADRIAAHMRQTDKRMRVNVLAETLNETPMEISKALTDRRFEHVSKGFWFLTDEAKELAPDFAKVLSAHEMTMIRASAKVLYEHGAMTAKELAKSTGYDINQLRTVLDEDDAFFVVDGKFNLTDTGLEKYVRP